MNYVGVSRHRCKQNVEFGFAIIVKGLRKVAGREVQSEPGAFLARAEL